MASRMLKTIRSVLGMLTPDPTHLAMAALGCLPPAKRQVLKSAQITTPIIDAAKTKQIVYCVALEPGMVDDHGDTMDAEEVEYSAHHFLTKSRVIKSAHRTPITAQPVESFVAPSDLVYDSGMYGHQTVKKGSWVLGIQVNDKAEWKKIVDGHYTGISVGGFGIREEFL